jgi:hypothetical protein
MRINLANDYSIAIERNDDTLLNACMEIGSKKNNKHLRTDRNMVRSKKLMSRNPHEKVKN